MEYGNLGDLTISGSGSAGGGSFRRVSISGSGSVRGDVACASCKVSGSARIDGALKAEEGKISGSAHITGDAEIGALSVSGSAHIDGNVRSGPLHVSGSTRIGGSMDAGEAHISGELSTGGGCSAETFRASGVVRIGGLLNADTVELHLHSHGSSAKEIGGGRILVEHGEPSFIGSLFAGFTGRGPLLTTDVVEGDDIALEGTKANVVRGRRVAIGEGCEIGLVEYGESFTRDDGALVRESKKL